MRTRLFFGALVALIGVLAVLWTRSEPVSIEGPEDPSSRSRPEDIASADEKLDSRIQPPELGPKGPGSGPFSEPEGSEPEDVEATLVAPNPTLWRGLDDPSVDGWDTEAFHEQVSLQLTAFKELLLHPDRFGDEGCAALFAPDFQSSALIPSGLRTTFEDEVLRVVEFQANPGVDSRARSRGDASIDRGPDKDEIGSAGFVGVEGGKKALSALRRPFDEASDFHVKIKVFRVEASGESVTTRQYVSLSGKTPAGLLEQNATWSMRWFPGSTPTIQAIRVLAFEQVSTKPERSVPLFSDCTHSILKGNDCYSKQISRGLDHWLQRVENQEDMAFFGSPGLAVGDADGDGLDDLYLCQESGLPNRLFRQREDGSVCDISEEAGVDWLQGSRSALFVDLDNDGDQDLVVAIAGHLVLAENDGRARFTIRTLVPTNDDTMSLAAADFDRDGDLDLYVCGYNPDRRLSTSGAAIFASAARDFVFHDANNGGRNSLLRNDFGVGKEWHFTDVTVETGMDVRNRRYSFAASWEDFDLDGDEDLYVANDYGRDNLYRNDRGPGGEVVFEEIGGQARVEDSAGGMSITWGDYDRDGWMDAFVSNMFSAAGNRIARQPSFKAEASPEFRSRFLRFARGNTLLKNLKNGRFIDRSAPLGVEMGRWAWGSVFADLNNDGWQDLYVTNGYMTSGGSGGDL